jgi:hypothetical protein
VSKKDKKKDKARRVEEVVLAEPVPREVADDLVGGGAGLCYGEPVRWGGRTVIPVARVGGSREAVAGKPLGYIEMDSTGARYVAIGDGGGARERVLAGIVAAAAGLLGALVGVALGRRGR